MPIDTGFRFYPDQMQEIERQRRAVANSNYIPYIGYSNLINTINNRMNGPYRPGVSPPANGSNGNNGFRFYENTPYAAQAFVPSNKIKIMEQGSSPRRYVEFEATPELSESKNTNYIEIADIREPASILIFISSPGRTFNVNAKLISRTQQEATENFNRLHLMKSWSMPEKGLSARDTFGRVVDSDVPRILQLYGYGSNIKGIPIVMKSINVEYSVESDYISTSDGAAKMPIILPITMSFQEIRSADDMAAFSIDDYRAGKLELW